MRRRRRLRDLFWRLQNVSRLLDLLLAFLIRLSKLSLTFFFGQCLGTDLLLCAFPLPVSFFGLSFGTALFRAFLLFLLLFDLGLGAALLGAGLRFALLFDQGLGTTLLLRAFLRLPLLFNLLSGRLRKGIGQRARSKR